MRAVVQRVKSAGVYIDGSELCSIQRGLLVFVGSSIDDTDTDISYIVKKTVELRIFEDEAKKMNLSVADIDGEILVVSQFTLYGDLRKGRRPSFSRAGSPKEAEKIYNKFIKAISERYHKIKTGRFQAMMSVHIVNDGPVTILLDSKKLF